ncbi:Preprotein translocase subunit [Collinsella sp. AK_207A]|uniref:preprotein translocase subunit YajC n=1 Tax=Collinsella sp. AK_207A TaxID=2650472 RepID=UPI001260710C|nr:preprotein translocase subunit YajC [Collinsella sp. AK_207A]VWL98839.1 Preprotein translocase subunit [Collinsella sp. AK_207A]
MSGFWGNVLASSVALLILFAIMGVVYLLYTRSGMKKKASYFEKIHTELAPGHEVMFGGGIFGTVKSVDGDVVQVKVRSGAVMDVSRYAIQEIK